MKKICLLFFLILMLIVIDEVGAYEYKCGYYKKKGMTSGIHVDFEVDNGKLYLRYSDDLWRGDYKTEYIMDYYVADYDDDVTDDQKNRDIVKLLNGRCPQSVYVCSGKSYVRAECGGDASRHSCDTEVWRYAVLFSQQYQVEAKQYDKEMNKPGDAGNDSKYAKLYFSPSGDGNSCETIDVYKESVDNAEIVEIEETTCSFVKRYLDGKPKYGIMKLEKYYNDCHNQDKEACIKYNKNKNTVTNYCHAAIQYTNYNNPCVKICAKEVPLEFARIEGHLSNNNKCRLSDKMIKLLANIVKMGKYFAPVLVIILSILDFIKAIASQSEEEIKKAQARFVKRLIVAALLFIVPLIIQFILEKFNIVNEDPFCKII